MMSQLKFWPLVLLFGIAVQALGIVLFCSASTTKWFQVGKPLAFAVALLGVVILTWFIFRSRNKPLTIIPVGLVLGFGYLVAFHLVGVAAFPGLLRDVDAQGYWISLVRVLAAATTIHAALALVVFGGMKIRWLHAA